MRAAPQVHKARGKVVREQASRVTMGVRVVVGAEMATKTVPIGTGATGCSKAAMSTAPLVVAAVVVTVKERKDSISVTREQGNKQQRPPEGTSHT